MYIAAMKLNVRVNLYGTNRSAFTFVEAAPPPPPMTASANESTFSVVLVLGYRFSILLSTSH